MIKKPNNDFALLQFHYNIGMVSLVASFVVLLFIIMCEKLTLINTLLLLQTLYSMAKGQDMDDIIFSIAWQVNHGINTSTSPELRLELAEVNEMAARKAYSKTDYTTACSSLSISWSLMPKDHWKSHYDQSLRTSLLWAKACYSCGDMEKAKAVLKEILRECHCLEDKLSAYYLLGTRKCKVSSLLIIPHY